MKISSDFFAINALGQMGTEGFLLNLKAFKSQIPVKGVFHIQRVN